MRPETESLTRLMLAVCLLMALAQSAVAQDAGLRARVDAPAEARVGEAIFLTVSIVNDTDSNFDFRPNQTDVILGGDLLGSVGWSTLDEPHVWMGGGRLIAVGTTVYRHSTQVVGFAEVPVVFDEPGVFTVNASFVRNDFEAVLQDRENPSRVLRMGVSTSPIRVQRGSEEPNAVLEAIERIDRNVRATYRSTVKNRLWLRRIHRLLVR